MRRRLWYLLAWAVATTVTVGVSWLGIRSVLVVATPSHVTPLSAVDLREVAPGGSAAPAAEPTPTAAAIGSPTSVPSPTPTPSESWASFQDGRGGTAYRRTFRTAGGDVRVVAARGDVQIEESRPKSGFQVNVNRQSAESVMVTFSGPRKATRVWAKWTNGPYAEVTEVTGVGL